MASGGARPASQDSVQYGLQYGIVTQNKDPENMGRIKVRLPWLDQGDTDQTHWAQLVTPMCGQKFGWYTLPDIDDVVIVAFIAGDQSQPVILGGVWSTADNSPEPNSDGKNNFRGYRSRTGARLILDDSDKTKVVFADKTGKNMIGLGNFDKAGEGPNVCAVYQPPMSGEAGISISTMEGKMQINCTEGVLKITAKENVKINVTKTIDIKADQGEFNVDGSSTTKVTSSAESNYDAAKIDIA
jgi:uncharacterized protein involved in type VI secretion and phage assembly